MVLLFFPTPTPLRPTVPFLPFEYIEMISIYGPMRMNIHLKVGVERAVLGV